MKICVYTICKNEEKNAFRWLQSAQEADAIYVSDTGSTDRTVEILEQNPKVHLIHGKYTGENFRFDYARNEVLDMIPEDMNLCIMLDFDCIFNAGWRLLLEQYLEKEYNWKDNLDNMVALLDCKMLDLNELDKNEGLAMVRRFLGFSFIKGARYIRAVHEDLYIPDTDDISYLEIPESVCLMIHDPDIGQNDRKLNQYLDLAVLDFEEFPTYQAAIILLGELWGDPRMTSYQGKDRFEFSLEVLNKVLSIPVSEQNQMWYKYHNNFTLYKNAIPDSPLECLIIYYSLITMVHESSEYLETQIKEVYKNLKGFSKQLDSYLYMVYQNLLHFLKMSSPKFLELWDPEIRDIFRRLMGTIQKRV